MKVLIGTLLTLSVGTAFAATTTATVPSSTGTSTASVAAPSALSEKLKVQFDSWNEKSETSLDKTADKDQILSENTVRFTYKLDEKSSVRLLTGFYHEVDGDTGKETNDAMDTYVQYATSQEIAGRTYNLAVRPYFATKEASRDAGLILPQARIYLSSDIVVNEKLTITPFINPRFYVGDNSYQNRDEKWGRLYFILESSYTFNDRVSYTLDLIHHSQRNHGGATARTHGIDNWVTVGIAGGLSVDLGLFNLTSANDKLNEDGNNYYMNLTYKL
jgi:hypothetical protein